MRNVSPVMGLIVLFHRFEVGAEVERNGETLEECSFNRACIFMGIFDRHAAGEEEMHVDPE